MAARWFRAHQRIQRELKEMEKEDFSKSGISVETTEVHFMILKGKILGPSGTPYEGGTYILEIKVPDAYPFKPVKVRLLTKIWHPNICMFSGIICLSQDWVPCMTLRTVLLPIQALLSAPEPDCLLLNAIAAKQFKENHELFERTAKDWSQLYAGAPGSNSESEEKKINLVGRGVDEEKALVVDRGVDEEKALVVDRGVDEERTPVALSSSFWNVGKTVTNFLFRKKN